MADSLLKSAFPKELQDFDLEGGDGFVDPGYWANGDSDDVVNHVMDHRRRYERSLDHSAIFNKVWRSVQYYYGFMDGEEDWGDTAIQVTGEHGQMLTFNINMYRYVIRQLLTLITADPPIYKVVPGNVDAQSQVQARLGERVLNFYLTKKGVMKVVKEVMEDALVYGTAFIEAMWDASDGDAIFDDEELDEDGLPAEFYEGDVRVCRRDFLDVIWDVDGVDDEAQIRWIAVRVRENRFDLAARYPDMAEEILALTTTENESTESASGGNESTQGENAQSDDVFYYRWYARGSDALPDGRCMFFLEEHPDNPLLDIDLPYRRIPILPVTISKIRKTLLGWSPAFDFQKQQELIAETLSKIATIQDNLGLPILWAGGKGVEQPDPDLWVGGIAWVESEKEPKVINLGQIPEEMYRTLEICVQSMEKAAGLNDSVQGQSAGSLRANRMQVFQAEQSLRFNSDVEQAFFRLFEQTGTMILEILQDFPENDRLISVVGKNNEDALVTFAAEDLYSVTGVTVEPGSRVTRTTEGRLEILNLLSQNGVALPKEELLAIVNGAPIEAVTQGAEGQLDIANAENEELMRGGKHKAIFCDNHLFHMKKHAQVLNSPTARRTGTVVKEVAKAIMEHTTMYSNPKIFDLQMALGYADMPPPGGGGGGGAGGPPPKAPPAGAPPGGQPKPKAPGGPAGSPQGGGAGALPERMSNA